MVTSTTERDYKWLREFRLRNLHAFGYVLASALLALNRHSAPSQDGAIISQAATKASRARRSCTRLDSLRQASPRIASGVGISGRGLWCAFRPDCQEDRRR